MVEYIDETEDDVEREIRLLPNKSSYNGKVKAGELNSYQIRLTRNSKQLPIRGVHNTTKYEKLLEGKVDDDQFRKDIIAKAPQVLRERIVITATLEDTLNKVGGIIKVVGLLPEDEIELKNFFIGMTIPSNEWHIRIKQFGEHMAQMGRPVVAVLSEISPPTTMTIDEITGTASLD